MKRRGKASAGSGSDKARRSRDSASQTHHPALGPLDAISRRSSAGCRSRAYLRNVPTHVEPSELSYGQVFLVTELEGQVLHYVVERMEGEVQSDISGDAWFRIRPAGYVTVLQRPQDGVQELRASDAPGGPWWLASWVSATSGTGRPAVYTFTNNGMTADLSYIFAELGFRPGDPVGYELRRDASGGYRAQRSSEFHR